MAKGDAGAGGAQPLPPSIMQQHGIKSINFHPGQGPIAPSQGYQPPNINLPPSNAGGPLMIGGQAQPGQNGTMPVMSQPNNPGALMGNGIQSAIAPSDPSQMIRRQLMGQQ